MNKYGAKKTVINGITFDSKREGARYLELMALHAAGEIAGLTLQVPFEFAKAVKYEGAKRTKPALRYVADFVYSDVLTGQIIVEDVKGFQTEAFKIKRHLMKAILNIEIKVTK